MDLKEIRVFTRIVQAGSPRRGGEGARHAEVGGEPVGVSDTRADDEVVALGGDLLMAEPTVPGVPGAIGADGVIDAVPPGIPGPRRVVEVVTHYLEMRAAPGRGVPPPPPG